MNNPITSHKISRRTLFKVGGGLAAAAVATRMNLIQPALAVRAAAATVTKKGKVTQADRKAAASRLAKYQAQGLMPQATPRLAPNAMPDYFGTIPNYANSPLPVVDALGNVTSGGMHKFVDALPMLGNAALGITKNGLKQYLPVATPDTITFPGSDYYEISLVEYSQQMHSDLGLTKLRGYVQTNLGTSGGVNNVVPEATPQYLGPIIIAQRDTPVRVKFTNALPTGTGGDLFIPTDTTAMGAGAGPQKYIDSINFINHGAGYKSVPQVTFTDSTGTGAAATAILNNLGVVTNVVITNAGMNYSPAATVAFVGGNPTTKATGTPVVIAGGVYKQNRATLHLHGGDTVWISDGTPHQWTTPVGEPTANNANPYPKGVSVVNVPDMPAPGPGQLTFYYCNQQSARLMFYHDHSYGTTRLNVYAGEAAGYLVQDAIEKTLVTGGNITVKNYWTNTTSTVAVAAGTVPATQIPLVIQDRTFLPDAATLALQDPTWPFPLVAGHNDLWFPHVYMPNQNPSDLGGANAMGRWDYGPWFWPPFTGLINGPVTNPLANVAAPWENATNPGTPLPTQVPESFMDTPVVNGTAYPTLTVPAAPVRFRILNAANDRFFNLSLFVADPTLATLPLTNLVLKTGGSGYTSTDVITVTITPGPATASATFDPLTGTVSSLVLTNAGSGYGTAPTVSISAPAVGVAATAIAIPTGIGVGKEVKMVPATPGTGLPPAWPTDGRDGGVPDPKTAGPAWIQIGTEGGFLPAPAVIYPTPIGYDYNRRSIVVLNVLNKALFMGPAERADVIVDFSLFGGKTLILYNDAPAPVPGFDPRIDYYTGDPDNTSTGGAPSTMPGYGPNTRTIMQINVSAGTGPGFNLANLQTALPAAFNASQPAPIVPQARYIPAFPGATTTNFPTNAFVRIQDNYHSFIPVGGTTIVYPDPVNPGIHMEPKAIQELFDVAWGRMNSILGVELPFTNMTTQTTIPYGYVDPATEIFKPSDLTTLVGSAGDGTQIWKITHNGVDTHAIHFHLFNVQLLNRVGWDGAVKAPDDNELGWKDTVRMNPLEDAIVAIRPVVPANLPWPVPNSVRLLDPTMPLGSAAVGEFTNIDPNNLPVVVTNQKINLGWEYVWHCHLLGHEENDMMRAMLFAVPPSVGPTNLVAVGANTPLRVNLTWTALSAGAQASVSGLTLIRATDAAFTANVTPVTLAASAAAYTDSTVVASTTYYYKVVASNLVGGVAPGYPSMSADSAPSNTVQVGTPAAPTVLAYTQAAGTTTPIVLTWTDNAPIVASPPNDVAERNFTVQRSTSPTTGWVTLTTTVAAKAGTGGQATYSDTRALSARRYYYRVFATNFYGSSAASNTLTVNTH